MFIETLFSSSFVVAPRTALLWILDQLECSEKFKNMLNRAESELQNCFQNCFKIEQSWDELIDAADQLAREVRIKVPRQNYCFSAFLEPFSEHSIRKK